MHWLENIIRHALTHYGYWAILGALLGENAGLPLPGETTLMFASFLAHKTQALQIIWVIRNRNSFSYRSASVSFLVLQALLGLYPYAPLKVLFVDPYLPEWLPEVRLENLQIGGAHLTLRFTRSRSGRTDYSVEELRGELHVLRQPSPWSFTAGWVERVKDAVLSLLPGK